MELEQNVDLNPSETKALTFTFDRTEFNLWDKIPVSDQTSVAISGSWIGYTPLIEDVKQNNLGWNLRVHFMEPYDGGYDEKGNYIQSSGSYNAIATAKWIKEIDKLQYELFTNYDISIAPVPGRPPSTPYWSSLVDGLTSYTKFPLELYNSHFSDWFIQYSNYCTDLSLQIGDLELLEYQSNYIIKSVPAVNTQMQINSARIETHGGAWYPITQTGGGELNITMASVPYDLTGTGVKESQPPTVNITKARMVSPSVLGIDATVGFSDNDPIGGPRYVEFRATINGQLVKEQIDITDLVGPGESKSIEWVYSKRLQIDLANAHDEAGNPVKVPRFTKNEKFNLEAVAWSPTSSRSQTAKKEVEILLPVIIVHGWGGENLVADIPLRIYDNLIDRLKKEGYTTDDSWYKTIWYKKYDSQRETPSGVANWLDNIVEDAIGATYANRVNIIGHSLGGLVGRYYITNHMGASKVHKLVMVGTPNKGSSQFYIQTSGWSIKSVSKKIDKSPLAQWLIPAYEFPFEALYDTKNNPLKPSISNSFPDMPAPLGVAYYSIYNTAISTSSGLTVEPYNGWYRVINKTYNQTAGDGTVPWHSANLNGANNISLTVSASHAFLTKNPEVQTVIIEVLKD